MLNADNADDVRENRGTRTSEGEEEKSIICYYCRDKRSETKMNASSGRWDDFLRHSASVACDILRNVQSLHFKNRSGAHVNTKVKAVFINVCRERERARE